MASSDFQFLSALKTIDAWQWGFNILTGFTFPANNKLYMDIHEKNRKYLLECTKSARYAGKKLGFQMISCDDGETPYSIEQIQQKIMECIRKELNL